MKTKKNMKKIHISESELKSIIAEEVKKIISTTDTPRQYDNNQLLIQQSSEQEHNDAINLMKGFPLSINPFIRFIASLCSCSEDC